MEERYEKTNEMISEFDKEELMTLCRSIDISSLIGPLASHKKQYAKQLKLLGNLDKKSALVQKLLPKTVYDLYIRGDENYKVLLSRSLKSMQVSFEKTISECNSNHLDFNQISNENVNNLILLFEKFNSLADKKIDIDLFVLLLKTCGAPLPAETIVSCKEKIILTQKEIEIKNAVSEEKAKEVRRKEKELSIKYEQQKEQLYNNIFELKNQLNDSREKEAYWEKKSKVYEELVHENENYYVNIILNKYKNELDEKKAAIKKDFDIELTDIDKSCQEEIHRYTEKLNESKELLNRKRDEIIDEIAALESKRDEIKIDITNLEQEITSKESEVAKVDEYIDSYFNQFDTKILEHKIENTLATRYMDFSNPISNCNSKEKDTSTINLVIDKERTVPMGNSYSDYNEDLVDFIHDFSDNLTLFVEEPTEIAANILSALLTQKSVIVPTCMGEKITGALSVLIDLSTPLVIDVNAGKVNPNEIINAINDSDSQIVYIIGLLDNYEDGILDTICRKCTDRCLFYSISDMSKIKMMSRNIYSNAVILDIEKYLTFDENDELITGNYYLHDFAISAEPKDYLCNYKKYFSGLVNTTCLTKKQGLDFSIYSNTYFSLISGETPGSVFKDIIFKASNITNSEDSTTVQAFKKCGIDIQES